MLINRWCHFVHNTGGRLLDETQLRVETGDVRELFVDRVDDVVQEALLLIAGLGVDQRIE